MYKNDTSSDEILSCVSKITDIVPRIVFPDYGPIIIIEWDGPVPSPQDVKRIKQFLQKWGKIIVNDFCQPRYISIIIYVK